MNDLFQQYFPQAAGFLKGSGFEQSNTADTRFQISPSTIPPPKEPSYPELQDQYGLVPQRFDARNAANSIEDTINAVKASSSQAGQNAARAYSARQTQQGQNPLGAGVVEAQVKNQGFNTVRDLAVQRDTLKLQANKDAAMVAAGIAEQISSLRNDYTKTLADYNARQAGLDFQTKQANVSNDFQAEDLVMKKKLAQAQLAQLLGGKGETAAAAKGNPAGVGESGTFMDFFPGYITNSGPIIGSRYRGVTDSNRVYYPGTAPV